MKNHGPINWDPHLAIKDLLKLLASPWGRTAEGCVHTAALVLSFRQFTAPACGPPPSFLIVHGDMAAKRGRDLLWTELAEFRRSDSGEPRRCLRIFARGFLEKWREQVEDYRRRGMDDQWIEQRMHDRPVAEFLDRLAPRAMLQRVRTANNRGIGVLAPKSGMASIWIGADSQAAIVDDWVAKGLLEGRPVIASRRNINDALVVPSLAGGLGVEVWRRHVAPPTLGGGSPLLGLRSVASGIEPHGLDPRFSISLKFAARAWTASRPPPDYEARLSGDAESIARILQNQLRSVHPGYLGNLSEVLRWMPPAVRGLLHSINLHKEAADGLARVLADHACRGIAVGSLALLPEVWRFSPCGHERQLAAALDFVRERRTTTRRDIQRKTRLYARERDMFLDHLETKGLITVNGRVVEAVPEAVWVDRIPGLFGLPDLPDVPA